MAEVKLPFKAARKGRSEPKLYLPGDDVKGKDAEIGRALGCVGAEKTAAELPAVDHADTETEQEEA